MKVKHLVGAFLYVGRYACSSLENRGPVTGRTYQDDIEVDETANRFIMCRWMTPLIENSAMGFTAANGIILAEGFQVKNTTFSSEDETWTQPWGENKKNRNHYNEMAVSLINEDQVQLTLRFVYLMMESVSAMNTRC